MGIYHSKSELDNMVEQDRLGAALELLDFVIDDNESNNRLTVLHNELVDITIGLEELEPTGDCEADIIYSNRIT